MNHTRIILHVLLIPLLPLLIVSGCTVHFDRFSADILFEEVVTWPDPAPVQRVTVFVSKEPYRFDGEQIAPDNSAFVEVEGVEFSRLSEDGWYGKIGFHLDPEQTSLSLLIEATESGMGSFNGVRRIYHWETVEIPESIPTSFQYAFEGARFPYETVRVVAEDGEGVVLFDSDEDSERANHDPVHVNLMNLQPGDEIHWTITHEIQYTGDQMEAGDMGQVVPIYRRMVVGTSLVAEASKVEGGEQ